MDLTQYMSYLKISQAAKLLGVSTRTLMRWDKDGKFLADHKEKLSGIRFYDEVDVRNHVFWFELRRKHKENLRKLDKVNADLEQFRVTQPLQAGQTPKFHKYEDMKRAYDALREWKDEHDKILKEYSKLPSGFKAKVDPE